ncbi:restriction system-associated AAA family ATPase [Poseidonibacter lekithochrous]|uniref:restriction system-associated AAA family ATPase n=1 Tax=Poseidonibacter lekithochrous TaxID=1904463 RepID=UPI000D3CD4D3|nr:restriction system-associated AAA family ATPase [Poseidonibacter lekithochrous]
MKLLKLELGEQFRSLHKDFNLEFHKLTSKGYSSMMEFQPFCFAGLNGSGKSNVLEVLASIFYHLEFCVAKFRPISFEKHFNRKISTPNIYKLEYLISNKDDKNQDYKSSNLVTIIKKKNEKPKMTILKYPFDDIEKARTIPLVPPMGRDAISEGKMYLPDLVVGYSSGENEILSLPFIKNRLVHLDEYKESIKDKRDFIEPETSLVYIDEEMSQAVLLACLIFEDKKTLKPLKKELGILGIQSFRMNLHNHFIELINNKVPILNHIDEIFEKLKKCTAFHFTSNNNQVERISIDFLIDENTKKAFRKNFGSAFELFRVFQLLYELNNISIHEKTKEEVYKSKGVYTDGKIPVPELTDKVFYFLDYMILKKIKGEKVPRELLLREFSDGEHQFIHTMGISIMLKSKRTLLLLDEPETHFNPGWRAKFIKVLNDSIQSGGANNFIKDVVLTSHSPFIISDCLPNNVIFFKRNKKTKKIEPKSASSLNFNTYGTSVEIILDELFGYDQSIGDLSNSKLKNIKFNSIKTLEDKENIKKELRKLGDSLEKDLVIAKINRIKVKK